MKKSYGVDIFSNYTKKIIIVKIEIKITISYLIVNFTYFVNLLCFDMLFL